MGIKNYSAERNVQIIIALLKANQIRKVVVSPGATNVSFVASIQSDPFFEMYSVVDERSAAYFACGLSKESKEVVVLSCTGATSSRNYMPGLTEAFYAKLPILTITSSMTTSHVEHLYAQSTNRSTPPIDVVVKSFVLQPVKDADDEWDCTIKVNKAISYLTQNGGGPVHLDLTTQFSMDFSVTEIAPVKMITRIDAEDSFPKMPEGQIAIFIGAYSKMSKDLINQIDSFCAEYDAVVLCDHTSEYNGKYRVLSALYGAQELYNCKLLQPDLLIHMGEISGDYYTIGSLRPKNVWRVNEDGEFRDRFQKLSHVFKMKASTFFQYYIQGSSIGHDSYLTAFKQINTTLYEQIPELPFSNIWTAFKMANRIPQGSVVHLGILQPLRSWNFFESDKSVRFHSNVGGFGIDGNFSTLVGASIVHPETLYFGVVGDLSFFYDINIIGNRHLGNNIRLFVINNGKGVEFCTYGHRASIFGEDTDSYIAAIGHNGNQSSTLIRDIAKDLGFLYLTAHDKDTFSEQLDTFVNPQISKSSIIFEIFTNTEDEVESLKLLRHIFEDKQYGIKEKAKEKIVSVVGLNTVKNIKKIFK
mgnify:FL=1|jgi:2-succinyl-5-enolpyruvyl-6-hydroxy-3-cyclohexene-1-carboxylate synthase